MATEQSEAGWYPDPEDPQGIVLRFWDGSAWTEHRSAPEDADRGGAPPPPSSTAPPGQFRTTPVSDNDRRNIIAQQIQASAVRGLRVESQDRYQAILLEGQPVNHVLHAILTLGTCGLWGIVWAVLAATGGQKRHLISVDEYGNVVHQQLGKA
jgi:hypothetical protein